MRMVASLLVVVFVVVAVVPPVNAQSSHGPDVRSGERGTGAYSFGRSGP